MRAEDSRFGLEQLNHSCTGTARAYLCNLFGLADLDRIEALRKTQVRDRVEIGKNTRSFRKGHCNDLIALAALYNQDSR